jgi:biotin-(acetyl-CoA carboxylase) ligase
MDKNEKERLVEKIIKELNRVLRRLKRKGSTDLARRWNEKAYRLGEEIFITRGNSTIKGRFAGINEAGHLLLEMGNEKISVEYGEVNFVSDSGKC